MKKIKVSFLLVVIFLFGIFSDCFAALDTDHDGMPDQWELTYRLNSRNENDAFSDPDKDGVGNLVEYFLGTNPRDNSHPVAITVGTSSLADYQFLEDAILMAEPGTIIKVQKGAYEVKYQGHDIVKKVFVQGGWDETFTTRKMNPYLTRLNGANAHAIINIFVDWAEQTFIFDCLSFERGSAEYGVVEVSYFGAAPSSLALFNCVVRNNKVTSNFGSIVRTQGVRNFLLVNTIVAGNTGTGIYEIGTQYEGFSKIVNSTISHNSNYGFRRDGYQVPVDVRNSIIWGNREADVYIEYADVNSDYSDIGSVVLRFSSLGSYTEGSSNINMNPLFADPVRRNFTLRSDSPCIDQGERSGSPIKDFHGQTRDLLPDIGADEYKYRAAP